MSSHYCADCHHHTPAAPCPFCTRADGAAEIAKCDCQCHEAERQAER